MRIFTGAPPVLFALVVILGVLNFALEPAPARRNVEVLPEMVHSVAAESFTASHEFSDGKTLQAPPSGTVLRGATPFRFAPTPADAIRAGAELANPLSPVRATLDRGEHVFTTFCLPCHGPEGKGDGVVAKRGFPTPPSLLAGKVRAMKDGQIFHIVTHGGENMPRYSPQIAVADRWSAILWVRELQKRFSASVPPKATAPPPDSGASIGRKEVRQ